MTLLERKEVRDEKLEALRGLIDAKDAREDKTYTEEEVRQFDSLEAEVEALDVEIKRAEKEESIQKRKSKPVAKKSEEQKVAERFSITEAVRQAEDGRLTGMYAELDAEGRSQAASAGVSPANSGIVIPEFALRADATNTATEGTQPADGGNLIPTDRRGFIEHLYDETIMNKAGVTLLNGLTGNIEMPTEASVVAAAWASETETVETQKATFGKQEMSPERLAIAVEYSTQLLRQSSPSIDAILSRQINNGIADKLDETFINGGGSIDIENLDEITGTLTGTALDYAFLVEIMKFQKTSNRGGNFKVISSPKAMAALMDSYRNDQGTGAPLLQGETLATGMQFLTSNKVADDSGIGVDETLVYSGDFSDFYVGAWGGLQLIVDNLTGATSAKTKIIVNSFWDMHNTRPDKMTKSGIIIP